MPISKLKGTLNTTAIRTMTVPFEVPHTQNTAPVLEFKCLYTSDLRRKQKRWQDGRLKYHTFNKRVMVYDERSNFVGDVHWREDCELGDGEELQLERGGILVQVQEKLETHTQDLTELVDKRRKEKEARAAARTANAPLVSFTATRIQNLGMPARALTPRPLNSLWTPSGHHGRAQLPTESPFEERQRMNHGNQASNGNEPPPKRRKPNESTQAKSGYAQNLTGTMLTLASSKSMSIPTIRYETFMPKFAVYQKSRTQIGLKSDEEQDNEFERKVIRQGVVANWPNSPQTIMNRTSPPAEGGYASNLTGAARPLNRPAPISSARFSITKMPKKSAPVQSHESSKTSSEENDQIEIDAATQAGKHKGTKKTALLSTKLKRPRKNPSPDIYSPAPEDQLVLSSPAVRTAVKAAKITDSIKATEAPKGVHRSGSRSSRDCRIKTSPPIDHPNAKPLKSRASLSTSKACSGGEDVTHWDSSASEEPMDVVPLPRQPMTRPEASLPTTKDNVMSRSNPESGGKSSDQSPTEDVVSSGSKPNGSICNTVGSVSGNVSEKSTSSLRIRCRQPRRMMMLMDRPNSRTFPFIEPTTKSRPIIKNKTKATKELVLSQATRDLDSNIQRHQEQIQARLNRKRPRPNPRSDGPSPAPIDSGISQLLAHNGNPPRKPSMEQPCVQNRPKFPNDTTLLVPSLLIVTIPGASSPKASSPKTSSPRLSSSRNSLQVQGLMKANNNTNPQQQVAETDNEPCIAGLEAQDPSLSTQLKRSLSNSDEPYFEPDSLGPIKMAETSLADTDMSSRQDFASLSLVKVGGSKVAENSRSDTLPLLECDAAATEYSHANKLSKVKPDVVIFEDKWLGEACLAKDLRDKRGTEIMTKSKLPTCSPPHPLAEGLQIAIGNSRAIAGSSPGSINRTSEASLVDKSSGVEHTYQDSPQVGQDKNQASSLAQLELQRTEAYTPSTVQEASGFKPLNGVGYRTVNDFGSKWQGLDSAINSEFALSIATPNQPKFKLSKPIQRASPMQPLGPSPPRRAGRAAGSADDQRDDPQDNATGGMPVTAMGPWSREAFDLFGSWKPPGGDAPAT